MRHEFDHCPEAEAVRCTQLAQTICRYEQLLRAVDELDFGELRCALTDLSSYKGLVLVDVHAADGTIVHITV